MRMGPGKHLHGLILPGGLKGEDFDYFHELVVVQELSRIGAPGYMAGKACHFLLDFEVGVELLSEVFGGIRV